MYSFLFVEASHKYKKAHIKYAYVEFHTFSFYTQALLMIESGFQLFVDIHVEKVPIRMHTRTYVYIYIYTHVYTHVTYDTRVSLSLSLSLSLALYIYISYINICKY